MRAKLGDDHVMLDGAGPARAGNVLEVLLQRDPYVAL